VKISAAAAARRRQLLARIHRRFETITEPLRVGAMEFAFTRIADPNRVLDQVAEEEDRRDKLAGKRRAGEELHLPYWAELWDSSLAIIDFLAETLPAKFDVPKLSVLDLGCGMGLTGTVAAAMGGARALRRPRTRSPALRALERDRVRRMHTHAAAELADRAPH